MLINPLVHITVLLSDLNMSGYERIQFLELCNTLQYRILFSFNTQCLCTDSNENPTSCAVEWSRLKQYLPFTIVLCHCTDIIVLFALTTDGIIIKTHDPMYREA